MKVIETQWSSDEKQSFYDATDYFETCAAPGNGNNARAHLDRD